MFDKTEYKVHKIKGFVRKTVSGEVDMEESMSLVKQFVDIAFLHPDHNILVDMRDSELTDAIIIDMVKVSLELANVLPGFKTRLPT